MKGKIIKTEQGWMVKYEQEYCVGKYNIPSSLTDEKLPLHPDNVQEIEIDSMIFDNIEARIAAYPDVEFETVNMGFGPDDNVLIYAKLIKQEYPEIEGTMALCNDIINKRKMTVVDWLEKAFNDPHKNRPFITKEEFEQAKEMHKQEIIDASNGYTTTELLGVTKGEYYYQETFKKD